MQYGQIGNPIIRNIPRSVTLWLHAVGIIAFVFWFQSRMPPALPVAFERKIVTDMDTPRELYDLSPICSISHPQISPVFFFFFSLLRMFNSVCDGIRQLSFCCLIWCVSSARSVLAPFCGFDFELDTHSRRRARGCVFDVWSSVSALGIKSQIDRSVKKR